jgi:hypothetical protein
MSTTGVPSNAYTKKLRGSGTRHRMRVSHAQPEVGTALCHDNTEAVTIARSARSLCVRRVLERTRAGAEKW